MYAESRVQGVNTFNKYMDKTKQGTKKETNITLTGTETMTAGEETKGRYIERAMCVSLCEYRW